MRGEIVKKSKFILIILTYITFITVSYAGEPFVDVPEAHWAYDAVEKISKSGIIKGYPDMTFKGKKYLTRYEFAKVLAKLMDKMDAMGDTSKYSYELELLKKLSKEFADELKLLRTDVDDLKAELLKLKSQQYSAHDLRKTINTSEHMFGVEPPEKNNTNPYSTLDKFAAGVNAFFYKPDAFTKSSGNTEYNNLIDNETGFNGFISYTFKNAWRAKVSYGQYESSLTGQYLQTSFSNIFNTTGTGGNGTYNRITFDYDIKPLELKIYYLINNKDKKFQPYAGIGIGKYKITGNIRYFTQNSANDWVNVHINESPALWSLNLGADYFLSKNFALQVEASYIFGDELLSISPSDISTGSDYTNFDTQTASSFWNASNHRVNFDNYIINLGFVMYFD